MTSRFTTNIAVLLGGAFLVAASLGFGVAVLGWVALGVGIAVVLVDLVGFAVRGRGVAQRAFDACLLLVGVWCVVESRCFGGLALKWLTFADGVLLVIFSFAGLVVHEVMLERALRGRPAYEGDGHLAALRHAREPVGVKR